MALKKKPEPSLAERITEIQNELEAWLQEKVATLRRCRDYQDLPAWDVYNMLRRHDDCSCRVVQRLLSDPDA